MKREIYEPPGFQFLETNTGRTMILVTGGPWKGWLAARHPGGDWVSVRQATDADRKALYGAIWPENRQFYLARPAIENCPEPALGWEATTCEICHKPVWKSDREPDVFPVNVRPACTRCALVAQAKQSGFFGPQSEGESP